jgi:hypothetical protein
MSKADQFDRLSTEPQPVHSLVCQQTMFADSMLLDSGQD